MFCNNGGKHYTLFVCCCMLHNWIIHTELIDNKVNLQTILFCFVFNSKRITFLQEIYQLLNLLRMNVLFEDDLTLEASSHFDFPSCQRATPAGQTEIRTFQVITSKGIFIYYITLH